MISPARSRGGALVDRKEQRTQMNARGSADPARRRARVLWLLGALLAGTLIGVLVASWLYPAPDTAAIQNSSRTPVVTAQVQQRPVRTTASITAELQPPALAAVNPTVTIVSSAASVEGAAGGKDEDSAAALPQAVLQVVSARIRSVGDRVSPGDLLAEVSGRPVYAFPLSAPLYRDLAVGSAGNDVRALQRMLSRAGFYRAAVDGRFRSTTLDALKRLFSRDGYRLAEVAPGVKGLALAETARVPGERLRVAAACPAGRQPTAHRPLLRVETRPAVMKARVDLLQADGFREGASVQVQIGGGAPTPSKVLAVSEFKPADSSTPPGYDISVALPKGIDVKEAESRPILITEAAEVPQAPSVPLAAIRRDPGGSAYVLVASDTAEQPLRPEQVEVTVIAEVAGYAVLADNAHLAVGTEVVVSGG